MNSNFKHSQTIYSKRAKYIIYTALGIAFILIVLFAWQSIYNIDSSKPIDYTIFDSCGSIVGGLIGSLLSFASFLLVLDSIDRQEQAWHIDKLDSRFFELIKFHKENISNLYINENIQGYKVLRKIKDLYIFLYNRLNSNLKTSVSLLKPSQYDEFKNKLLFKYTSIILGFGCNEENYIYLKSVFNKDLERLNIQPENVTNLNDELDMILNLTINLITDDDSKYFTDNEEILRMNKNDLLKDYFSLLHRIVIYINDFDFITYIQKLEYIRLLKSILIIDEQILIFLNAITDSGKMWELEWILKTKDIYSTKEITQEQIININKCLITKYDLIRNIPVDDLLANDGINARFFFPNVFFQKDLEKTTSRQFLEKLFK